MKTKFRAVAVLLALMMVLSAASLLLVACGGNREPDITPSTGTTGPGSLVTDEGLVSSGKLKAMYTFEDSGRNTTAVNPYTGASQTQNNGEYYDDYTLVTNPDSATSTQSPHSLSVRNSGFSVGKLTADQYSDESAGLSISFWAYNDGLDTTPSSTENNTLSFDFMNLATNGNTTLAWGLIRANEVDMYPSQNETIIGRGAYHDEMYARAQAVKSDARLALYDQNYAGYNAISGNVLQGTERDSTTKLADSYQKVWRYVTVVIDQNVGISFYANGRLAYTYSSNMFSGNSTGGNWSSVYEQLVWSVMESEPDYYLDMFNDTLYGDAEVYVDDVIIGSALTADECKALYENLSGKTVDTSLVSTAGQEAAEQETAISEYLASLTSNLAVEGDTYGTGASASVSGTDKNDDGKIDDQVGDAKAAFLEAYNAEDYLDIIGSADCNGSVTLGQGDYYIPTLGSDNTFSMTVSGIQLSDGQANSHTTYATMYSNTEQQASVRHDWSISNNVSGFRWNTDRLSTDSTISGNITWVDFSTDGVYNNVLARYSLLDVVFAYDGTDLTITYNYYYYFVGQTVTLTTASGSSFQYTVPKDSSTLWSTVSYTIPAVQDLSITDVYNLSSLSIKFGSEYSAFLVTGVTGGTQSETAPDAENPEAPAPAGNYPLYTFSNGYVQFSNWAQVVLPTGDFNITYTADVYTAQANAWEAPAFVLFPGSSTGIADQGGGGEANCAVYVRGDNYAFNNTAVALPGNIPDWSYTLGDAAWQMGQAYLCEVTPIEVTCNIVRNGNVFTVNFYIGDSQTAVYSFTYTHSGSDSLVLLIGGEGTYMENIAISGTNSETLTLSQTTSGTKTQVSTDGYTQINAGE